MTTLFAVCFVAGLGLSVVSFVSGLEHVNVFDNIFEAEARAMNVKAVAYQEWNQAAVVDKLMTQMPEIVRAMAAPPANGQMSDLLSKVKVIGDGSDKAA